MRKTASERAIEKIERTVVQDLVNTARGVQLLLEGLGERRRCPNLPEITRGMVESLRLATRQVDRHFLRHGRGPLSAPIRHPRKRSTARSKRPRPVLLMPLRATAGAEEGD